MINLKEINQNKIIDQIRCLGIDMIHEANSGHPGIVLGAAPAIYTLFAHHLNFDPENPDFFNRDRFVMSAGHGSALLYATLYMAGYDISLDDLKQFRKIGSKTPGHPEYGVTPGVDCTTGPLGQGFATAVGMAIAEANLRARYKIIDHYTYVLCGDGDLMEGISYEAASLAGTLKLNRLIVLYDSNGVCLDGNTKQVFTENIGMRFVYQGWNVIVVEDGNSYEQIVVEPAIKESIKSAIAQYNAEEITTKRSEVSKNCLEALQGKVEKYGIIVEDFNLTNFNFSAEYTKAIEEKQVAEQRLQKSKLEAEAKVIEAQATKKSNDLLKQSLTDELIAKQFIEKWDGKLPETYAGGNILKMFDIK